MRELFLTRSTWIRHDNIGEARLDETPVSKHMHKKRVRMQHVHRTHRHKEKCFEDPHASLLVRIAILHQRVREKSNQKVYHESQVEHCNQRLHSVERMRQVLVLNAPQFESVVSDEPYDVENDGDAC